MDYLTLPTAILAILSIAAASAGVSVYYKKNAGQDALDLAQRTIGLQKDENALLIRKNAALQAQLDIANNVIEKLSNGTNSPRAEK